MGSLVMASSTLQKERSHYIPDLPPCLMGSNVEAEFGESTMASHPLDAQSIGRSFPRTYGQPLVQFTEGGGHGKKEHSPVRIGVVFCGRQSPGGHNVICGLHDAIKSHNPKSVLLGFCGGTEGLFAQKALEISEDIVSTYRNQGGYDMLGRTKDQIRTTEQVNAALTTCQELNLDSLVIIGGVISNTDAAQLAETFAEAKCSTKVVGIPVAFYGDLKNQFVEANVGFDTICKVNSQLISNICTDALSAEKYYYFIRLMGRRASHVALECALQSHPNMVILSEEVSSSKLTLFDITKRICDAVQSRAEQGYFLNHRFMYSKNTNIDNEILRGIRHVLDRMEPDISKQVLINKEVDKYRLRLDEFGSNKATNAIQHSTPDKYHGVILLPEGLIESIPEVYALLQEIHGLLKKGVSIDDISSNLSPWASALFESMPPFIKKQLLLSPESDESAQLSQIETEKLLAQLVETEMEKRTKMGTYKGKKFNSICHFFGYQARGSLPSKFDCDYSYVLGHVAYHLVAAGVNGYMATVTNLKHDMSTWRCGGAPLTAMMTVRSLLRGPGSSLIGKPSIHPVAVDLTGKAYELLVRDAEKFLMDDLYSNPGPIQYKGPGSDSKTISLCVEDHDYIGRIKELQAYLDKVRTIVKPGCPQEVLKAAVSSMTSVIEVLSLMSHGAPAPTS